MDRIVQWLVMEVAPMLVQAERLKIVINVKGEDVQTVVEQHKPI